MNLIVVLILLFLVFLNSSPLCYRKLLSPPHLSCTFLATLHFYHRLRFLDKPKITWILSRKTQVFSIRCVLMFINRRIIFFNFWLLFRNSIFWLSFKIWILVMLLLRMCFNWSLLFSLRWFILLMMVVKIRLFSVLGRVGVLWLNRGVLMTFWSILYRF